MAENFIPANQLPMAEGDEVSVLCVENGEMKQKSANFTPAQQWPIADGDEVSVLCIENGELKQKSASGLSGKTAYDLEVRITGAWDAENGNITSTSEILSGSYDAVLEKLDAGIMPSCLVIECGTFWDGVERKAVSECCPVWMRSPDGSEEVLELALINVAYMLKPDGTVLMD